MARPSSCFNKQTLWISWRSNSDQRSKSIAASWNFYNHSALAKWLLRNRGASAIWWRSDTSEVVLSVDFYVHHIRQITGQNSLLCHCTSHAFHDFTFITIRKTFKCISMFLLWSFVVFHFTYDKTSLSWYFFLLEKVFTLGAQIVCFTFKKFSNDCQSHQRCVIQQYCMLCS